MWERLLGKKELLNSLFFPHHLALKLSPQRHLRADADSQVPRAQVRVPGRL